MNLNRLVLILGVLTVASGAAFMALSDEDKALSIEFWHGAEQRVGHLGSAQPDFNVMGVASGNDLFFRLNGGEARELTLADGPFGFRRLGSDGHFNADIPIAALQPGSNTIEIIAKNSIGDASGHLTLNYEPKGSCPLPFSADWTTLAHIQDAGQAVDGLWELTPQGLRSRAPLYDRLFLMGNTDWLDYDVRTTMTVHSVAAETGPKSGAPGLGLIMRFAGHSVDPPRFPDAQPKWGFQPFGAILWLRWTKGSTETPVRQFYRGDKNASEDFAALDLFTTGATYDVRASCTTDAEDPTSTVYRLKIWIEGEEEPAAWDFEVTQTSQEALRGGGVAFVAHHVDVTFGALTAQ